MSPAEHSWLDSWLNVTTWWIEPATRASVQAFDYGPERILVEVVDGLAQRFGGGPLECSVHGRSVVAHLDWVRLVRRHDRHEGHLQLSRAAVDGFPFDRLSAVARSVQVASRLQPRVVLEDIEVKGRSELDAVVAWLATRLNGWGLAVEDGTVIARHRRDAVELEVEPSVEDDRVQVELRALRWRGRRLPVPAWLRLTRTVATLELQPGVTVVEGRRKGRAVEFELRIDSVEQKFELAQIRDAILHRARVSLP
jgi:hypothetical protein